MLFNWLITDKGDQDCRRLADRHYSRQTIGALQFTRNGQNLVFITADLKAVWVTFRPTPGIAKRPDGLDAWECALFRNEGPVKSSLLIREAVLLSCALWGEIPQDGFITFIKEAAVATTLKGYCYRRAGWRRVGQAKDGKPMFRAPRPALWPAWQCWSWRGGRGGKLRRTLEGA
jgi:hypothetical protein